MDRDLQVWLIVLMAVMAISVTIQLGILAALFLGVLRATAKIREVYAISKSRGAGLPEMATRAVETMEAINRVAKDTAEVAERIKPALDEAAGLSRKRLAHADQVVGGVLTRVDRVSQHVEETVIRPVREIQALMAGLLSALSALLGQENASKKRNRQSGSLRCIFLLFLSLSVATTLRAQQVPAGISYEGQPVADVDLVARPTLDVESFRHLVVQQAGQPYSNQQVQQSIAALKGTGQFTDVELNVTPEAGGLRLEFILEPAFYVGMLDFPGGLQVFSYPRLLEVVNYPAQEPYKKSRVEQGRDALGRFLAQNGYFMARVEPESQLDEARQLATVVYHITLGKRARLGRIQISGPPPEEAARLENALRSIRARLHGANLKQGKRYDPGRIHAAERFLQSYLSKQNHLASQIQLEPPSYDPETNRAALHFGIAVGPTVVVRTVGARLSKRSLQKLLPIYEERAVDQGLVEAGARNVISHFQSKGYFHVQVTPQVSSESSDTILTYVINRGSRYHVAAVTVTGNRHLGKDELMDKVLVRKARLLSRGKFSETLVQETENNLEAHYRDAGFADVKVIPRVLDRAPNVSVIFEIEEGMQTLVDSFRIEGNRTQQVATLAPGGLTIKPGQPYSLSRLNQDKTRIVATYLNLGYLNASFRSTVVPVAGNRHRVAVTYVIEEGPQVHVSQVTYTGEKHSRLQLIERVADIHAGADLSEGKLLEAESGLYNLGVFDWANVSPRRAVTNQTAEDVLVKVHESKRNSISYGLGFKSTPRSGSLSTGVLVLPGLPTVGLPSSFKVIEKTIISPLGSAEYSRLNMRGRAETASISGLISVLNQRASSTYSVPHFRAPNWSALWSVSAERTTQNPLFNARLGQASFQLERILDAAKSRRLQFRYTIRRTSLTHLLIENFVLPQDRSLLLSTLSASFVRDTRDKPLDAHRGIFQTLDLQISPKVIGSSDNVARLFGQTSYYWQVKPWIIWANNVRLGLVSSFAGSHVPFSERFFSGGADSLRGFPLNGAGPQGTALLCTAENDPSTCTARVAVPMGGHQLFIFNSEGRFPIPIKRGLGGVFFYDGGNVYERINFSDFISHYSNTVGFGLRYQTPVGPVRVDIGHNLNPVPGLKSTHIFVTLGQSF